MGSPIDPAIQRLLDGWLEAVQAGDVAAIVRHYSDDVLAFDAVAQLQFVGREAYAQHWRACLQACQQTRFERHHLAVEQGGDVAFGHYLSYCGGKDEKVVDADGEVIPAQDLYITSLANGYSFAARGSGTEPKMKFYLFASEKVASAAELPAVKARVKATLDGLSKLIEADAKGRAEG